MLRSIVLPTLLLLTTTTSVESADIESAQSLAELYLAKRAALQQVHLEWTQKVDRAAVKLNEHPAKGAVLVNTKCSMAAKGPWRFYDVRYTPLPGFDFPERFRRTAMSFNEAETRILMFSDHAQIFSGNKQEQFAAPDDFLALQLVPMSNFRIIHGDSQFACDLSQLVASGEYELATNKDNAQTNLYELHGPQDILRFDPARGWALVSRELFNPDGSTALKQDFDDLFDTGRGLWLAKRITIETYQKGQLFRTSTLVANSIEFRDVPDSLFSLEFLPGTSISDMRHFPVNEDGTVPIVNYTVPTESGELEQIAQAAIARMEDTRASAATGIPWSLTKRIVFLGNVVVIIILLFVLFRKRISHA